ncbi:MAG: cytochrome c family protein [Filomicrobium sp.]
MRFTKTTLSLVALSAAIALHAGVAQAGMTDAGKKAMQAAGEIMFEQRCRSCHADDPARKAYGPSLIGVIGRKAGSLEGFEYSDAMKNSGIIWNKNTLRAWMADNDGFMPGTRMRHVGIDDRTEQDFLLTYLTNLSTQ